MHPNNERAGAKSQQRLAAPTNLISALICGRSAGKLASRRRTGEAAAEGCLTARAYRRFVSRSAAQTRGRYQERGGRQTGRRALSAAAAAAGRHSLYRHCNRGKPASARALAAS